MHKEELLQKVEQWFIDKNLHIFDGRGQLQKLEEEILELKNAENDEEEIDAVGDIAVVLIGYCMQRKFEDRLQYIDLPEFDIFTKLSIEANLVYMLNEYEELKECFETKDFTRAEKASVANIIELLHNYCYQRKLFFWDCLEHAYKNIANRKGKEIDGIFVKEEDL